MGSKFLLGVLAVISMAVAGFEYKKNREADVQIHKLEAEVRESNEAQKKLREQLQSLQTELDRTKSQLQGMNTQAANASAALQELEHELELQRQRTEQKRKEYQDLLAGHSSGDPNNASKTKELQDQIATLEQKIKSDDQEILYTRDEAASAKQNQRNGADFAMNQANSRLQTAQATLAALKAQRAAVPKGRLHPESADQLAQLDLQIAAANGQLNDLKAERAHLQANRGQDAKSLDGQIGSAVAELKRSQDKARHDLEARRNDLKRLQDVQGVAGRFDKERNTLVQKLAAELQEETKKLEVLEARVHDEKAKLSHPSN